MFDKYKSIIFDWDGTLVDSHDWVLGAHNHVRQIMGRPQWSKDDIFGNASFSARETYPLEYGDDAAKAIEILQDYVKKNNHSSSKPYSHSEQTLMAIKSFNIPMGVVSNKRHEPLNEIIIHLKWDHYFKTAIGAGHAERDKPDPAPLFMAMTAIHPQLKPEQLLYIGDTETDLLTAKRAGCDVAFVQSDKPRPDLVKKYAPTFVWDDLQPLLNLIRQAA